VDRIGVGDNHLAGLKRSERAERGVITAFDRWFERTVCRQAELYRTEQKKREIRMNEYIVEEREKDPWARTAKGGGSGSD
jgi:hypothetical protein